MKKALIFTDDISMLTTKACRGLIIIRIPEIDTLESDDIKKKIEEQVTKEAHEQHANAVMNFKINIDEKDNSLIANGTAIWLSEKELPN